MSIYQKLNLQLASAEGFVAPAIIKWRYLVFRNLFKSDCLNHSFISVSAPLKDLRQFCTGWYMALLLYAGVVQNFNFSEVKKS
jgi:hypothetical protein